MTLQPRNYQVSKTVGHEIKFWDIAVMKIYKYSNTDWQFEMFKIGKDNKHGTRFKCKLKTSFLIFSNIYCWCTLELPLRGNSNV